MARSPWRVQAGTQAKLELFFQQRAHPNSHGPARTPSDYRFERQPASSRARHELGLARLVALHRARAVRLAALITHDPHLAEDVMAEAFLIAFWGCQHFDTRRACAPWFHRVVATTALKMLAARRREVSLDGRERLSEGLTVPARAPAGGSSTIETPSTPVLWGRSDRGARPAGEPGYARALCGP